MALPLKSQQDLYNLFITTLQGIAPQLTDELDGSIDDALAGVFSLAGMELQRYTISQFNKTFIDLANGPTITGGSDDLQTLLVDHFGSAFARPQAVAATDTITFSRPNNSFGSVTFIGGFVVKTQPDVNGNVQRYSTASLVSLTSAGVVTFTLSPAANATNGAVYKDSNNNQYTVNGTIAAGLTLVTNGTTLPPASGNLTKVSGTGDSSIAYTSVAAPDCKVSIGITAVVAGAAGDAVAGTINQIESTCADTSVVCSNVGNANGLDAMSDSQYREFARNLIISLRAATKAAIQAAALAVPGVAMASAVEIEVPVTFWNPTLNQPKDPAVAGIYDYFYIPFPTLYIADSSGNASLALIAAVNAAINPIRAFGVNIVVANATAVSMDWEAFWQLNPSGPNYSTFVADMSKVINSMQQYIVSLAPGVGFTRQLAEKAILDQWGPTGTNDLVMTLNFVISGSPGSIGGLYTDGTYNFTVAGPQSSFIPMTATGRPAASGTLTKVSGPGVASFSYTSFYTGSTAVPAADISITASQKLVPGNVRNI